MPPQDFRSMAERLQVPNEPESGAVVEELRAFALTLPDADATTMPRRRVWTRLSSEIAADADRAQGAA